MENNNYYWLGTTSQPFSSNQNLQSTMHDKQPQTNKSHFRVLQIYCKFPLSQECTRGQFAHGQKNNNLLSLLHL